MFALESSSRASLLLTSLNPDVIVSRKSCIVGSLGPENGKLVSESTEISRGEWRVRSADFASSQSENQTPFLSLGYSADKKKSNMCGMLEL